MTSYTYRINDRTVDGKVDNLDAIKQAITHILSTERYSNVIYDKNYGVELEQFIGEDYGYLVASIEPVLKEALMQDTRITNVIVDNITEGSNGDGAFVEFTVYTIYGNIQEGINVLQ